MAVTYSQKKRLRKMRISKQIINPELCDGFTSKDLRAILEARAIEIMHNTGPVQACRLNYTYRCDGYIFNTGKRHRKIG